MILGGLGAILSTHLHGFERLLSIKGSIPSTRSTFVFSRFSALSPPTFLHRRPTQAVRGFQRFCMFPSIPPLVFSVWNFLYSGL